MVQHHYLHLLVYHNAYHCYMNHHHSSLQDHCILFSPQGPALHWIRYKQKMFTRIATKMDDFFSFFFLLLPLKKRVSEVWNSTEGCSVKLQSLLLHCPRQCQRLNYKRVWYLRQIKHPSFTPNWFSCEWTLTFSRKHLHFYGISICILENDQIFYTYGLLHSKLQGNGSICSSSLVSTWFKFQSCSSYMYLESMNSLGSVYLLCL